MDNLQRPAGAWSTSMVLHHHLPQAPPSTTILPHLRPAAAIQLCRLITPAAPALRQAPPLPTFHTQIPTKQHRPPPAAGATAATPPSPSLTSSMAHHRSGHEPPDSNPSSPSVADQSRSRPTDAPAFDSTPPASTHHAVQIRPNPSRLLRQISTTTPTASFRPNPFQLHRSRSASLDHEPTHLLLRSDGQRSPPSSMAHQPPVMPPAAGVRAAAIAHSSTVASSI
ncbi:hypothetical protein ACLOJK_027525 [Asimina triloba]